MQTPSVTQSLRWLRATPGAPMHECAQALKAARHDAHAALAALAGRCSGTASRSAPSGALRCMIAGSSGVLVEARCATDFCARSCYFRRLLTMLAGCVQKSMQHGTGDLCRAATPTGATAAATVDMASSTASESVRVAWFSIARGRGCMAVYNHHNGRACAAVECRPGTLHPCRRVALHAAAHAPRLRSCADAALLCRAVRPVDAALLDAQASDISPPSTLGDMLGRQGLFVAGFHARPLR
ncbi:Elongation factor Ts [Candidatus Tremblaya princeps]|uniref:Elongation factor Ts n=1 Tax=Tremblaya princeps TaxID=189385 RepID=A0A143WND3_TREPR|nr:Elongation factor Ts [Candidatus Tremblaya princeps]